MDHIGQVHRAKNGGDLLKVVVCAFLEDKDFGMIVEGKGFFSGLVVDHERSNLRVGLKHSL